jgi:hypothetical protein
MFKISKTYTLYQKQFISKNITLPEVAFIKGISSK